MYFLFIFVIALTCVHQAATALIKRGSCSETGCGLGYECRQIQNSWSCVHTGASRPASNDVSNNPAQVPNPQVPVTLKPKAKSQESLPITVEIPDPEGFIRI